MAKVQTEKGWQRNEEIYQKLWNATQIQDQAFRQVFWILLYSLQSWLTGGSCLIANWRSSAVRWSTPVTRNHKQENRAQASYFHSSGRSLPSKTGEGAGLEVGRREEGEAQQQRQEARCLMPLSPAPLGTLPERGCLGSVRCERQNGKWLKETLQTVIKPLQTRFQNARSAAQVLIKYQVTVDRVKGRQQIRRREFTNIKGEK